MNKFIAPIARLAHAVWHFFKINYSVILFAIAYILMCAASLYAFFIAFGWWMIMFFVISIWMAWWLSRWLVDNTLGE